MKNCESRKRSPIRKESKCSTKVPSSVWCHRIKHKTKRCVESLQGRKVVNPDFQSIDIFDVRETSNFVCMLFLICDAIAVGFIFILFELFDHR